MSSKLTAELKIEREYYNPGETAVFYLSGDNANGIFTLGIYKDKERYKTIDISSNSYSFQLDEVGSYSAYMTSYGYNGGLADSNWVYWKVLPLTAEMSIDKTKCNTGDTVTLYIDGNNNHKFANQTVTLGVWIDGKRIVAENINADTYKVDCSVPGEYSAYFTAYGGGTYKDSNWVYWSVKDKQTVQYDANGGIGAPQSQTKDYGKTLILSSTKPTRNDYSFINWNTKADGSGKTYEPGGNYIDEDSITLYAQWAKKEKPTVTPEPTVDPTPTVTPDPTPTVTPEPTDIPTPTITPTLTPIPEPTTVPDKDNIVVEKGNVIIDGDLKYLVTDEDEVSVIGVETSKSKVVIPAEVTIDGNEFDVIGIEKNAFKNDKVLTNLVIEADLDYIGTSAFAGCKKLKNLDIIGDVEKISSKAFYKCKKLKLINIETEELEKIGKKAFAKIYKKAHIIVPGSVLSKYEKLFKKAGIPSRVTIWE